MSDYRNISDLKLEEITEEFLRDQCIEMGTDLNVDTRQGSFYRDSAEGHIRRTAYFFDALRHVAEIIGLTTCTGDVLNEYLIGKGLTRNPPAATPAHYYCNYTGAVPEVGDIVTCDRHEFTVESVTTVNNTLTVIIVSTETGTEMNYLAQGTTVIPAIDVNGLISCTLGALYDPAEDAEDDESARERFLNSIAGPDGNGNASQIRSWCESVEGVGKARIVPLWNGPTTVKAVLIGEDGKGAATSIVNAAQAYIDPNASGMGEGVAAIGQFVTCVAATSLTIDVSLSVVKQNDVSLSTVKSKIEAAITAYLKSLAMEDYTSGIKVRYQRISALIMDLDEVVDIDDLLVNSDTENISFTVYQVPVLGEVTVSEDN